MINTVNTEFCFVEVWFTNPAGKALEIEDRCQFDINYWVVIIRMKYSTEARFRKYLKGYGFLSFARKLGDKYGKKLMDTATKQEEMLQKLLPKEYFKKLQKLQEI